MHNSNGRTVRPFDFGIELTPDRPLAAVASLAQDAEAEGIDAALVSNHFDNRDPFLALAAIAARTERLRIGPGVVNPMETHPVRVATQMATLAESAPDRVFCGIGAGDRTTLGKLDLVPDRPVSRVAEAIDIVRRLTGGNSTTGGGIHDLADVSLSYSSDSVPVFVGAQGPTMLRMAGELADGVLVNASHPADARAAANSIATGRERRKDARGALNVAAFACVSVADSPSAAREAARPPVAFVAAGAPSTVLERHEINPADVSDIRDALEAGDHPDAYRAVTPAMLETFSVAGTVDEVTAGLRALTDHVDAIVAGSPLGPDRQRAIELLGGVATRLRAEAVIGQ